jgi:hypothetical protein
MKSILILIGMTLSLTSCASKHESSIYRAENLIAWCVVPYDTVKRDATQRAAMLKDLGFTKFAWDWRSEHIDLLRDEIEALKQADIELSAVWFWIDERASVEFQEHHERILAQLAETGTKTTLWIGFDSNFFEGISDSARIVKGVEIVRRIKERADPLGLNVALYNHGDWFGEPENQIKILQAGGFTDVGLVYNFHHAHHQLDDFPRLLEVMMPYLWTINLNGMRQEGPKILDIGLGNREADMMRMVAESGFKGTIGILGHAENEDVKETLKRNLNGLRNLVHAF